MGGMAQVNHLVQPLTLQGRNGNDDFPDVVPARQLWNIIQRTANRHALHTHILFVGVIVHHNNRVAKVGLCLTQVHRPGSSAAGAHNHQRAAVVLRVFVRLAEQQRQTGRKPCTAHKADDQDAAHQQGRAMQHRISVMGHIVDHGNQHRRHRRQHGQANHVTHTGVFPNHIVQAAQPEADGEQRQHPGQILNPQIQIHKPKGFNIKIQSLQHCKEVCCQDQAHIHQVHQQLSLPSLEHWVLH